MAARLAKNSIRKRLVAFMILLIVFQSIIVLVVLSLQGVFGRLDEDSEKYFLGHVTIRADALEKEMEQRWSSFSYQYDQMVRIIQEYMEETGLSYDELSQDPKQVGILLDSLMAPTVGLLHSGNTTGAFIVLDAVPTTEPAGEQMPGIMLQYANPKQIQEDESDVLLVVGPPTVSHRYSVLADEDWTFDFDFKPLTPQQVKLQMSLDYFYKPLYAAQTYPSKELIDLGYWSPSFRLTPEGSLNMTYSLPLIGEDGEVFGVAGVAISQDYFQNLLPIEEIVRDGDNAYFLAVYDRESNNFYSSVYTGFMLEASSSLQPIYSAVDIYKQYGIIPRTEGAFYKVDYLSSSGEERSVAMGVVPLKIYHGGSPFADQTWYLAGLTREQSLYISSQWLQKVVIISLLLSLVLALTGVLYLSGKFVRPISKLVGSIQEINPYSGVEVVETGIAELDVLSSAVGVMANDVAEASSKVATILELTDLLVGVFEVNQRNDKAYVSATAQRLLELPPNASGLMDQNTFTPRLETVMLNLEEGWEDVYFTQVKGEARWLRIRTKMTETKVVGTVMDLTREVLEKRRMDFERDYDSLTHLFNRQAFYNKVYKLMEKGQVQVASMIKWDLDSLKYVNDTYGHNWGDQYLCTAAQVLAHLPAEHALAARNSGDEFFTFLYGFESKEHLYEQLWALRDAMDTATLILPNSRPFKVRSSAGFAWYPDDTTDLDTLIRYADYAMFEVKNSKKGTSNEFDAGSYEKFSFLINKKESLNVLIDSNRVRYAFQPIVDAVSGEIFAYEALMRPDSELFSSPLEVLQIARSQSKLHHIERQTIFNVLDYYQNKRSLFGNSRIFINTIPSQVLEQEDVQRILSQYHELLPMTVFEMTEGDESLGSAPSMLKKLEMASQLGVQIAIDDFGSGYSNESAILNIKSHYVKFDIGLIKDVDKDLKKQQLLKGLVEFTQTNGILTIAEGIETEEELHTVVDLGVNYLQGYFLAKPSFEIGDVTEEAKRALRGLTV
ncbi:EAL domain-containing protein [Oscillospiraceae bacterium MB08-C2-2]|nr:EAL domain-containing protein [Oscillospiraceae bacterium MB08-C2-2]